MSKVKDKIKNLNRVCILGDCAGAGKTYMATNLNDRTLFISPYNSQCQEIQFMGFDSINYHKLFGLSTGNDTGNTNKIDLGVYECI